MGKDIDINKRWFPPSPHCEEVVRWVKSGRAHIKNRGHNKPPLIIFEDGGQMELHRARISPSGEKDSHDLKRLVSVSQTEKGQSLSTRYTDVCGTMDKIKEILKDTDDISDGDILGEMKELIEHAHYMLTRMHRRGKAYLQFAREVEYISNKMNDLELPEVEKAFESEEKLSAFISENPDHICESTEELMLWAEDIRRTAGATEKVLYSFRNFAIELGKEYNKIRGARNWEKKE